MASLVRDSEGIPVPQYLAPSGSFEMSQGRSGAMNVNVVDQVAFGVSNASSAGTLSVGTTASQVTIASGAHEVRIYNTDTTDVFVGFSAAVTTGTGYPVKAGTEIKLPLAGGSIYVIAAAAASVRLMVI